MIKLFCALVGAQGSAFPVDIDASQSIGDLKDAIKDQKQNDLKNVDADKLQLFLAKKGDGWLASKDLPSIQRDMASPTIFEKLPLVDPTCSIQEVLTENELPDPQTRQIHVLVNVPQVHVLGKRTRADEWFINQIGMKKSRVIVDGNETDRITRYFEMAGFPPLAHPKAEYRKILERNAYIVIFTELMKKAKLSFEKGADCSLVVTGNPGIGKSRFYLYCIFHLIFRTNVEVKKLPSFDLVVNYGDTYHKFDTERHEFIELNKGDVSVLRGRNNVLRLVEATSSNLAGWRGVSILFAPPGVDGINDFSKVTTFKYIMPVWTLEELREYNSLLQDDLNLSDDVLFSRWNKFGGIPRFVFTQNEREETAELQHAVSSFSALRIISFAKSKSAVREQNYSHRVLQMVPSEKDLRVDFYLDFLSSHIAETIIDQVDQESIQKVSEFAVAHDGDDSGSTSVLRGKIYELLCHKWFSLPKQHKLVLRPLDDGHASVDVSVPRELKTVRFSALAEIETVESGVYYRPTSKTFGALDAFVFVGNACYGLQMTRNRDHGIKGAPLNVFLKWLTGVGVPANRLYFTFVVPSQFKSEYKKQSIRTASNSDSQRPGAAAKVNQFEASLDVFSERGTARCKKVVCDPSYLPNKVRKVGKVARAIAIMSHTIPNTNDSHSVQIILPQKQLGRRSDMYVFCCSYSHNVAPRGKFIAFVTTEAETDHPEAELKPGIDLLGAVDEIFFDTYDRYEPVNEPTLDNCFISMSYDATTHFESTVIDVLNMYTMITGKAVDLSVDLSAASAAEE